MIGRAGFRVSALLLAAALVAAACSSGGAKPHPPLNASASPGSVAGPTESSSPGPVPGAFVRTCQTSVYGDLGKGWRKDKNAVVVGPLALLFPGGYANAPRKFFVRHGTGYYSQKVLAVVEQGATVTIAVAPAVSGVVSLLYDPERFNQSGGYEVSDGERAVTFKACARGKALIGPPNSATQFPGGFIVAGPRCVPLEVWLGNDSTPTYRWLSFGASHCNQYTSQVRMADVEHCPVTLPRPFAPPPGVSKDSLFGSERSFGNGKLWVGGLGSKGVIVAPPDFIERDGSVGWKLGWWREVSGLLTIIGRRLDGPASPLRADVPSGYGMTGFQASGVYFPTEGCWEVSGRVSTTTLTFVTFVIKRAA